MSDEYRRGIEDAAGRVSLFTTSNIRRDDAVGAINALLPTDETHEHRWARLGYQFKWNEKYRAYTLPDPNFPDNKDMVRMFSWCTTISDVDAWIAAHPGSGT